MSKETIEQAAEYYKKQMAFSDQNSITAQVCKNSFIAGANYMEKEKIKAALEELISFRNLSSTEWYKVDNRINELKNILADGK